MNELELMAMELELDVLQQRLQQARPKTPTEHREIRERIEFIGQVMEIAQLEKQSL